MIGKWFLPLPFIFANKNYTLTFEMYNLFEQVVHLIQNLALFLNRMPKMKKVIKNS